ncbi:MAG: class II fructose-bisphosphate aldolase [Solobacterium sp.]|nr:class II fructose-bisphosphate aldolase [Solobacterium sp.]
MRDVCRALMYDASTYPLEENIRLTKIAVDYAHARGVTVEAELGHVGDGIVSGEVKADGKYDNPDDFLTDPNEMVRFIEETQVDCLAVAVGTSHGVYVHPPKLHFDRLDLLNQLSTVPMVMHGGSGTPDDQVKTAISKGICKLNIYSEMLSAYYGEMKKKLDESGTLAIWVSKANEKPLAALKQVVLDKIDLMGSAGKA